MDEKENCSWGKLSSDWDNVTEIIVYGFGAAAEVYFKNLHKKVKVRFIIDNSEKLKGKICEEVPIYSFEEAKKKIGKTKLVIMTETLRYSQISKDLQENGYIENRDFTGLERFICEWFMRHFQQTCLMEIHMAITTKCVFNCKNCNMFIPYYKNRQVMSLNEMKNNFDILFQYVDYVFKYQIVGGEPFLNRDLPDFLQYIYERYKDRVGRIRIITNGGVLPSEKLLHTIKECGVEVNVSNYLNEIDYKQRFNQVIDAFEEKEISYKVIPVLQWRDFGFPEKPCERTKEETRRHMLACGTAWHGLADGCLYYCNSAWSAIKCGLFAKKKTDYIDLKLLTDRDESKKTIIELCLGDGEFQYNSFCQVCGGCGEDNTNFVQAGVQM